MTAHPKPNITEINHVADARDPLVLLVNKWMQLALAVTHHQHCVIVVDSTTGNPRYYFNVAPGGTDGRLYQLIEQAHKRRQPTSVPESGAVQNFLSLPVFDDERQFCGTLAVFDVAVCNEHPGAATHLQLIVEVIGQYFSMKRCTEIAEASSREKADFASVLSHEIRTSVTAILGITDVLKDNPSATEYIQSLDAAGRQMRALVSDVLDYSKVSAGKMVLSKTPFQLPLLVDDLLSMYRALAEAKGLVLNAKIDGDMTATVAGDAVRLTQVLSNLLVNAIKFTERGSVTLHITMERVSVQNNLPVKTTFRVVDTGPGFSVYHQKILFTPFVQAATTSQQKAEGTGLGLSIAHDLVRLMGGELCLKSELGAGSDFFFQLFFSEADNGEQNAPPVDAPQFNGQRVLVVEDNVMNRMVIEQILSRWNLNLTLAGSGAEAIEMVQKHAFDIVLMDVQMPGLNGFDTTRKIRALRGEQLPVVGLTGFVDANARTAGMAAGMNDLVAKPLRAPELFAKMAQFISPQT